MTPWQTPEKRATKGPLTLGHYLIYLVVLWVCAWFNEGWMQSDEHSRTLEPALFILKGMAALPWEFTDARPMVSFLLGMIHAPILYLGECLHLYPPRLYVTMGQLAQRETVTYVGKTRSGPATFYSRFPPTMWRFRDLDDFMQGVEGQEPTPQGLFAIYRIDTNTLRQVAAKCTLEYESSPPIWRWALSLIPKSAQWQRTDVIVRCGITRPT